MAVLFKWFPNSWFQIKSPGFVIYIDPAYLATYFADYPTRIEFSKWPRPIDGLPEELEKADLILVTHHHKDHCKSATVKRLARADTLIVAPPRCLKELDKRARAICPGEEITFKTARIKATDAYNLPEGSSTRKLHHKGDGVGYLLMLDGKTIYHAGDTDLIPEMKTLRRVDVALLPIGGKFTMDACEAVQAAVTIKPKVVIPMHHLHTNPEKFKKELNARSKIKVVLLEMGAVYRLK